MTIRRYLNWQGCSGIDWITRPTQGGTHSWYFAAADGHEVFADHIVDATRLGMSPEEILKWYRVSPEVTQTLLDFIRKSDPEGYEMAPLRNEFIPEIGVNWDGCELTMRLPGRVSGVPTLGNSRLPADCIIIYSDSGYTAQQIIDEFYPGEKLEAVQGIIDYAAKYRAEKGYRKSSE